MTFKKGNIPWNIGKYDNKSSHWKGDKVGLNGVHKWIKNKLGQPKYCEICKRTDKKRYDWSNKNHKYRRRLKDWQRLCGSCHFKYDYKYNGRKLTGVAVKKILS